MKERRLFPDRPVLGRAASTLPIRLVYPPGSNQADIGRLQNYIKQHTGNKTFIEEAPSTSPRSLSILVGPLAAQSELGRKINISAVRGGYVWQDHMGGRSPAYWVYSQETARSNPFLGRDYMEDITAALTLPLDTPSFSDRFYEVETAEDTDFAVDKMRGAPWCAYDCETAGVVFSDYFEIHCLAVSTTDGETYVWGKEALLDKAVIAPLLSWFCDPSCKKVGHNIKFDIHAVKWFFKVPVHGVYSDTRLKRKLLSVDADSSLEVCSDLVGLGGYKQEFEISLKEAKLAIQQARKKVNLNQMNLFAWDGNKALEQAILNKGNKTEVYAYALVDEGTTAMYCARDAYTTAKLEHYLETKLSAAPNLQFVWNDLVHPGNEALEQIEFWGVRVDRRALEHLREYIGKKRDEMRSTLNERGLQEPDSSKEVSEYLFDELELKPIKRSEKTNRPSTASGVLKLLQNESEDAKLLLEYRRLSKLVDAYGESLHKYIRSDDRIHPEFKLDGTRTGRLSCKNPGLHQIPKAESEEGTMIKNCFIAADGHYLINLDYSQMELRVAAMLSEDEVMKSLFESGEDFHMATARLIAPTMWGIKPEDCTKTHRSVAKTFNFGLMYGMTDNGLAVRLQITKEEAKRLRAVIMGSWHKLAGWMESMIGYCKEHGCTYTTWAGSYARTRALYDINSRDNYEQMKARNGTVNTPVQGTASDYCLASLGGVYKQIRLGVIPAKIVLTVHDSIILEAPKEQAEQVARDVKKIMLSWPSGIMRFQVDCDIGERWGSLKERKDI